MTRPFVNNATLKGQMFVPDDRQPTHLDKEWDTVVAAQQPHALPPAGSAISAVPRASLPTGHDALPGALASGPNTD